MESAVERGQGSEDAPAEVLATQPVESEPKRTAPSLRREADDIPSVVRALLTGYDEA